MIKNKKSISKELKVGSVVLSVIVCLVTIFAGRVLANAIFDDVQTRIIINGEEVELNNKSFVANNTLYLPLREMLNLEGIEDKDIIYDNGCVEFYIYSDAPIEYRTNFYDFWINRVRIGAYGAYIGGFSYGSTENDMLTRCPILKDNITYVPYEVFEKLADSGQNVFEGMSVTVCDKNGKNYQLVGKNYRNEELNFSIEIPLSWCGRYVINENDNIINFYQKATYEKYGTGELFSLIMVDKILSQEELDKEEVQEPIERRMVMQANNNTYIMLISGKTQGQVWENYDEFNDMRNDIDFIGNSILPIVIINDWQPHDPIDTVKIFFAAFEQGNFNIINSLCTQNCIDTFTRYPFGIFGMEWARLKNISVDTAEYLKSANDFNVFVDVEMEPAEISVFDKTQTETGFYVRLLRQPDGKYLIDRFATGL